MLNTLNYGYGGYSPSRGYPIRNRLHEMSKKGLIKSKRTLNWLFDKNLICSVNNTTVDSANADIVPQRKAEFFIMYDIMERKYKADEWDIKLTFSPSYEKYFIHFIIHYPEVHISNSAGLERTLHDLVMCLCVDFHTGPVTHINYFTGTRLSLAHDEWHSGYCQSHLSSFAGRTTNFNDIMTPSTLCTGSSDLSELQMELASDFDADRFELMLYTLDSTIAWESLEGGPHFNMRDIVMQENINRAGNLDSRDKKRFMEYLYKELQTAFTSAPFNYMYSDGRIRIKNDKAFADIVKRMVMFPTYSTDIKDYFRYVVVKRGTDNNYYFNLDLIQSSQTINPFDELKRLKKDESKEFYTYINGRRIDFSMYNPQEVSTDDISYYIIHPEIASYVIEQLEYHIQEACIKLSGAYRLQNSSSNATTVS